MVLLYAVRDKQEYERNQLISQVHIQSLCHCSTKIQRYNPTTGAKLLVTKSMILLVVVTSKSLCKLDKRRES